jgi:hypothetical protein
MKTIYILLSMVLLSQHVCGQEAETKSKKNRWSYRLNAGISSFSSSGIPKSRNQINFESIATPSSPSYLQESRIVGMAFELGAYYRLSNKWRLGVVVNTFRDDEEYFSQSDLEMTAAAIERDSLQSLTIRNLQAYASLGFAFEYDAFQTRDLKHKLSFGLHFGKTINRTPKRTEYDYFAEDGFLLSTETTGEDNWFITHTRFNNGWFLTPQVAYARALKNKDSVGVSFALSLHRLSSQQEIQLLDRVSSGSLSPESYTLRVVQIKLAYTFS